MKRSIILWGIIAVSALTIIALPQRATEAENLFSRGVHFEEVRGELKEAIAIYEEIVKKYPENRPLAAKAYYHLGLCYQKLGRTQAAEAFQKVVEKYPDQAETVLLAKERLSLLASAEPRAEKGGQGLKISLIWEGSGMDNTGEISPDGKSLSCVDWKTSDLAVRDMATEKLRCLTSKEGPPGSYEAPNSSIWSPDSREIAYNWYNDGARIVDLRLIALDGSKPRVLYRGDYFKDWVDPCDWSPDGQYVLAAFTRRTDYAGPSRELGLVSVKDGSVHYLEAMRGIGRGLTKISPDGRQIVFEHPQKANATKYDLSIIPVDGKALASVVDHPADDRLLGWAPDGQSILFLSDRTGTWDAWLIPVRDGQIQGNPRIMRRELGMVKAMGLTKNGSLYYSTPGFAWDIFSVSIDPDSGRLLEGPQKLRLPYEGHNFRPRLSPDGDHLAYVSLRGPSGRDYVLTIFSFESGEAREIRIKGDFRRGFGLRDWMPDGRSILLRGNEMGQGEGLFKVDLQTGDTVLQLRDSVLKNEQNLPERGNYQVSHDGRTLYCLDQGPDNYCRVMTHRIGSKDEKEICKLPSYKPDDNNTLRLSPDGLWLALLLREEGNARTLKIFPVTGGEIREVHRYEQEGRWIIDIAWSPDGRYIYFSKQVDPKKEVGLWGLWRVPVSGGNAQNLRVTSNRIDGLNVHPDGKRIFFHSRTANEQVGAIWAMENFLPQEKAEKK